MINRCPALLKSNTYCRAARFGPKWKSRLYWSILRSRLIIKIFCWF